MTQIQIYDNKILVVDNKIAVHPDCCDVCDPAPPASYSCCSNDPGDSFVITATSMVLNPVVVGNDKVFWDAFKAAVQGVPFVCTYAGQCAELTFYRSVFNSPAQLLFANDPRRAPNNPAPSHYRAYLLMCEGVDSNYSFSGGIGTLPEANPSICSVGYYGPGVGAGTTVPKIPFPVICPTTWTNSFSDFPWSSYNVTITPA